MVLRNVAKTFSLDEQRVEINEIAQDVDSLPNLGSFSVTTNSVGTAALSYDNSTGTFSYTPPDLSSYLTATAISNSGNWDAAYGWGDHSTQGYATILRVVFVLEVLFATTNDGTFNPSSCWNEVPL